MRQSNRFTPSIRRPGDSDRTAAPTRCGRVRAGRRVLCCLLAVAGFCLAVQEARPVVLRYQQAAPTVSPPPASHPALGGGPATGDTVGLKIPPATKQRTESRRGPQ